MREDRQPASLSPPPTTNKRTPPVPVYKTFAEMEKKKAASAPLSLPKPPKAKATVKLPSPNKAKKKYEDEDEDEDHVEEVKVKVGKVGATGGDIWADSEVPEGGYDLDRDALAEEDIDEEGRPDNDEYEEEEYDPAAYEDDDLDSAVPAPRSQIKVRSRKGAFMGYRHPSPSVAERRGAK